MKPVEPHENNTSNENKLACNYFMQDASASMYPVYSLCSMTPWVLSFPEPETLEQNELPRVITRGVPDDC